MRQDIERWLKAERAYAEAKWEPADAAKAHEDAVERAGATMWDDWAWNYVRRATMFGLDTPQGRQALGKAASTLVHVMETAVDRHGPMPAPGVPSGVIEDWGGGAHRGERG